MEQRLRERRGIVVMFFPFSLSMSQHLKSRSKHESTQAAMCSNIEVRGQEKTFCQSEKSRLEASKKGQELRPYRANISGSRRHSCCHRHLLGTALTTG